VGLESNTFHLRKIFQDSKGNLWFGTNVYDLMMYDGDTLRYITKKEGFSGGRVTAAKVINAQPNTQPRRTLTRHTIAVQQPTKQPFHSFPST